MNNFSTQTLRNLRAQQKNNWLVWWSKLETLAKNLGCRTTEDITEFVTADDIAKVGFTLEEAAALVFVLTEDCMGQPVNSVEMIERYFCYEVK